MPHTQSDCRALHPTRRCRPRPAARCKVGIGGPVGGGKTALVAALCRTLRDRLSLAVVTNDIYTTEDADFLRRHGVLPAERIRAVAHRLLPAHRDPRRHHRQPRRGRRPESPGTTRTWCWWRAAGTT